MFDFQKPKIEIAEISEDKKYGKFVVEPLERGYGTTLGNSLRRIMLSSLPGAAVSQVKIDGVLHEFSSIPGVKEDVTEIIMNIKNLAIRNNSSTNEPKVAYIEFEGEGVVTAADIQVDSDIQILNPDLVIANLNGGPDCKLYMDVSLFPVILVSMYSIYSYGFRPFIFALSIMLYAAPLALAPLMLFENRKFFLPMTKLLQHLSAELLLILTRPSSI